MDIISKKNSILLFLPLIFFVLGIFFFIYAASEQVQNEYNRFWEVRAIDTMKSSFHFLNVGYLLREKIILRSGIEAICRDGKAGLITLISIAKHIPIISK